MKISELEDAMLKIAVEISKERSGMPVLLADLRERLPDMTRWNFDKAILAMAKNGYFLSRESRPPGSLTDAEKAAMVPDGAGRFYDTINIHSDAGSPAEKTPASGRGGMRKGSGRPVIKTKSKRVGLGFARIPGWLADWLKTEGDAGRKIEQALIAQYGLTPPD